MTDVERFLEWCPPKTRESVQANVSAHWDFVAGMFPVPRRRQIIIPRRQLIHGFEWPRCPSCWSTAIHYSHVSFNSGGGRKNRQGEEGTSTFLHRAEPQFKCTACSYMWHHGIPVRADIYERVTEILPRRSTWRYADILGYLNGLA